MADPNGVPFTVAPVRADDKEKTRKEADEEAATKKHKLEQREDKSKSKDGADGKKDGEDEDLVRWVPALVLAEGC